MAGNISDFLENKLLDHSLGTTSYTKPTTVYAALYTVAPTDSGGGTEVTGGSYARQSAAFAAASAGSTSNSADVTFPTATASWGTAVAVGILDAATGGNLLWYGTLSSSKTIGSGDTFKFSAGQLTVSLD